MESSEPGRRKTHCRTALILIKTHLLRREHALWGQSLAWDLLSQILDTGPPALLEWAPFLWPQWPLTAAWLDLAVLLQWPSISGLFIETPPRQVPLVWLGLHTWAVLVSAAKHCYWETDTSCFRYQAQDSMVDVSRPWQGPQPWHAMLRSIFLWQVFTASDCQRETLAFQILPWGLGIELDSYIVSSRK